MKKFASLVLVSTLVFSASSHAEGSWLDSIKSMIGLGDSSEKSTELSTQETAATSMDGMISAVSKNLGLTTEQAEGGLGSLMSYVKNNVSSDKFSDLSSSLPGMDQVLNAVPDIKNLASEGGLSGLMNKASEYSSQLKGLNEIKQQFEALGLSPDMISGFIQQAKVYLDTPQGQEAKKLLTDSLSTLM